MSGTVTDRDMRPTSPNPASTASTVVTARIAVTEKKSACMARRQIRLTAVRISAFSHDSAIISRSCLRIGRLPILAALAALAAGEALAGHRPPHLSAAAQGRPPAFGSPPGGRLPVAEVLRGAGQQGGAEVAPSPVLGKGQFLDGDGAQRG